MSVESLQRDSSYLSYDGRAGDFVTQDVVVVAVTAWTAGETQHSFTFQVRVRERKLL